ncbi:patatin-like phospholipase family protein [Pseudomonas sp. MWU13-3659]|uniref:patatin-like phospholipase family protein n=1 Tax=Pseudomonas sp. MWU13-3659 TaxID=2986964 RepID=UPI0020763743|nr:patatin-like phospholipase family protein [Pseudomonas sp. MWU13-3659]
MTAQIRHCPAPFSIEPLNRDNQSDVHVDNEPGTLNWVQSSGKSDTSPVTPAPQPEMQRKLLVNGVGARRICVYQLADGSLELTLDRAPILDLVCSGGGAKGDIYPGMLKALQDKGTLEGIERVHGASAGAITGVLVASGMTSEAFSTLMGSMDLMSLLDSKSKVKRYLQKVLPELAPKSIKQFVRLLTHLQSNAHGLQETLEKEAKNALLKRIEECPGARDKPGVGEVYKRLSQAGAYVTFNDLAVVSRVVKSVKTLSVTGTAMLKDGPKLVMFDNENFPDMNIALAAHISGAFPALFKRVPLLYDNQVTQFQDGGLMCNIPVPEQYLQPQDPACPWASEPLILRFQQENFRQPALDQQRLGPLDSFSGVPITAQWIFLQEQLKSLSRYKVEMITKTPFDHFAGAISGTLNFDKPEVLRNFMQAQLQKAVERHVDNHACEREVFQYATIDETLLALDDGLFEEVYESAPDIAQGIKDFRDKAKALLEKLDGATRGEASGTFDLDAVVDGCAARRAWLAKQLLQGGGRLAWLKNQSTATGQKSEVMLGALKMEKEVQVRDTARLIARTVVLPSLLKSAQSPANKALLSTSFTTLMSLTDVDQLKEAVQHLSEHYQSNHPDRSGLLQAMREWKEKLAETTQ